MSARAFRRAREREARRETKRNARLARRGVLGGVTVGATVIFAPASAHAATYEVNSLGDPGVDTCDVTECTLREAVTAANANAGHDDVTFQAGLSGTITLYNGEIPITEDVSIAGPGANEITVDANGDGRVFNADMPNENYGDPVSISGLTLTGGFVGLDFASFGGAVYSDDADLSISDADIRDNVALAKYVAVGGGVHAQDGTLTITDSIVANNVAYALNLNEDPEEFPFALAQGGGIANKYGPSLQGAAETRGGGGSETETTVTGSVIRNNHAAANVKYADPDFAPVFAMGGGSFNKYTNASFAESNVRQNIADSEVFTTGGGIAHKYGRDLTVTDSTLKQNLAAADDFEFGPGSAGGGISAKYRFFNGIGDPPPAVTITGSTLNANVSEGSGGGIATSGPELHVDSSNFNDNLATRSGGGADVGSTPGLNDPEVTFTDSTFTGNGAGKYGGAISLDGPDGPSLIQRTTLSSGYAGDTGGGLFIGFASASGGIDRRGGGGGEPATAVTIDRSTIDTNAAGEDGGGVAIDDPRDAILVSDSTVSGNTADHQGGGINSYNSYDVPVTVQNSTVADNTAGGTAGGGPSAGGGIYRTGFDDGDYIGDDTILLSSTIVADNDEADLGEGEEADGAFDARFSLVEDDDDATVNDLGNNIFDTDPDLGPLQDNGGPTETQQQSASSPVVDTGDDNGLTVDQRGEDRTVGAGTDIGAVELQNLEVVPGSCQVADANEIIGTDDDDELTGTAGPDAILALEGNDILHGLQGNDCLFGQPGRDQLFGRAGADLLDGGTIGDHLDGGPGPDRIRGGDGADTLKGRDGKDKLTGNAARDTIRGNAGKDVVKGNAGNDTLAGDEGNDTIKGGPDDDTLRGNEGRDRLICGSGKGDTAIIGPGDIVSKSCENVQGD